MFTSTAYQNVNYNISLTLQYTIIVRQNRNKKLNKSQKSNVAYGSKTVL